MEELQAPEGYCKAMPVGVTVRDNAEVQTAKVTDHPISGYFEKADAPAAYRLKVLDRDQVLEEVETRMEDKVSYSFDSVIGAKLACIGQNVSRQTTWSSIHQDMYSKRRRIRRHNGLCWGTTIRNSSIPLNGL